MARLGSICVNDVPEACDEYQSYLLHIFRLAIEDRDVEHISSSLVAITENSIGLGAGREHCLKVAHKIGDAKNNLVG